MIFQFIFDEATRGRSRGNRAFNRVRKTIVRYYDPVVHYEICNRRIAVPLSHDLALYRNILPTYATNLTRIAAFARTAWGQLKMIDVGANVGDSYCLVHPEPGEEYLLIEGNPKFFNLLVANTANNKSVVCVDSLLADEPKTSSHSFVAADGTARLATNGASGVEALQFTTLDQIVGAHETFRSVNLLKTDVDGFDTKVLLGARQMIARAKPLIFFEHDPALLLANKENDLTIFSALAELHYSQFILYDNKGFLKGSVRADDRSLLEDSMSYARAQTEYYYDVCCFNDAHAMLRDEFLAQERLFQRHSMATRQ
jgi:FkbM family methyltransferase